MTTEASRLLVHFSSSSPSQRSWSPIFSPSQRSWSLIFSHTLLASQIFARDIMHLLSFNDLVFVLSLGTVIVSASPIVGRQEGQLLGYMQPTDSDGQIFQESNRIVFPPSIRVTYPIRETPPRYFTPNTWECKVFDTNNLFALVKDKLESDQKKELPFENSGVSWQMAIPKVLVNQRPPTLECYRLRDAHKTMYRPKANWDALREACPKGTIYAV
ncbi:hypothetical protein F5051DRAFT_172057 [Lentinula edodes]|nr:hypothetical protein F5051DRAFT_172057 [Lentinula edodes]